MVYDPRDRQVTWADCAVGGALWAFALALLVLFGDRLPEQQALAAVHLQQNVSKAPVTPERLITSQTLKHARADQFGDISSECRHLIWCKVSQYGVPSLLVYRACDPSRSALRSTSG